MTIEEGFRAALGDKAKLSVTRGSDYEAPIDGEIDKAVRLAKDADVVVLVLGESASMSGEAQARVDIGIPAPQMALAEAVAATGKPIVVLLRHGRALALTGAVKAAPAIMATWFLGSETGNAHRRSGVRRLCAAGPAAGQLPASLGAGAVLLQPSPHRPPAADRRQELQGALSRGDRRAALSVRARADLFERGLFADQRQRRGDALGGSVTVTATVTNTGKRRCHEVAQLYINDKVASLTQPVRALKGIRHLDLDPGQIGDGRASR